jgi:hypothetical protein
VGFYQRELLLVFLVPRKATYCIVLYCIGSKRDEEIGWILTWEKINGLKEMEKLDGF